MNDVELRVRRALDVARSQHDPSAADAARVRARLKARVLAEPLLIEATPAPPARASLLGKLALALGGASAGFVAGFYVARGLAPSAEAPAVLPAAVEATPLADRGDALTAERAAARATEVASAARNPAAAASSGSPVPIPSGAASPVRPGPTGANAATPPPSARRARSVDSTGITPLKAELDGLRRAQELLHQGQPGWALERLKELDRADVSSALLEERMATRAIAECRIGGDAAALTDAFARRYPASAHREQVRASCERARAPSTKLTPTQTETRANSHE
jgi:hypothetical protein